MRYKIVKEVTKHGRKVETQWAVFDEVEDRVVVRYENEKQAEALLMKYEMALEAAKDVGK